MFADNEIDIINYLHIFYSTQLSKIALFPRESKELISVVEKVCDSDNWKNWIESSGKSDPPPDFYSDEFMLMMDIMRVNDHERKGKKGKLHNPSMKHDKELFRELQQSGILAQNPNANVFIIGDTQLPTYEDHNYKLYLKCFQRVLSKHIESIPLYKKNHPNHKVIFLVFDESSAYIESKQLINAKKQYRKGDEISGKPHFFFYDNVFMEAFKNKGIDYLFWYTPYKRFECITPSIELPELCVYDLSKLSKKQLQSIQYDNTRMISAEI